MVSNGLVLAIETFHPSVYSGIHACHMCGDVALTSHTFAFAFVFAFAQSRCFLSETTAAA